MTGSVAELLVEIDTSRGGWLPWQALPSAVSTSSITAKSAASARSMTWTRTVAFAGLLVKLTRRLDCQGREVSCTEVSATAMQGRVSANSPSRARKAATARGTTEARIRKRNMEHSLTRPGGRGPYGWRSVKKSSYCRVDAPELRRAPEVVGQCTIGQRFGEMQPAYLLGAVEVGKRARHPQHPVIAARGQMHGLGGIAQQLLTGRIRLRDSFQQRGRRLRVSADVRHAGCRKARELNVTRSRDAGGDFGGAFRRRRQDEIGCG